MSLEEEEEVSASVDAEAEADAEDVASAEGEAEAEAEGAEGAEEGAAASGSGTVEGGGGGGAVGTYNARDVNDQVFEELRLPTSIVDEVCSCWKAFLSSAESREAAGEAIYAALFDAAPSLQSLFKTPRAVMAMRFMNGLNQIISSLHDPKSLKIIVETLGFQHLDLEVTIPRVIIFRDAIVDLLSVEMGARFNAKAKDGFATFLNYVGGSYIFVRVKFSERLRILTSSWATATRKGMDAVEAAEAAEEAGEEEGGASGAVDVVVAKVTEKEKKSKSKSAGSGKSWFGMKAKSGSGSNHDKSGGKEGEGDSNFQNTSVPQTYNDMFLFNAAVMGFGNHTWMNEVLASFDTIVVNVANSYRLQEECDVLSLRMAKYKGTINLAEYKAVMLASLRSLVKDWGSQHEISWSWLWENVERMIKALMGKPAVQEKALSTLFSSLDENALNIIRREVYGKFFALAPAGQDYFKQSTTRLHFIADKLVAMTLDMYKDPKRMVEDISALGLRHVGYGIPTDLFGPFVTACVQVVRMLTDNDAAEEAFRWSLSLISRILTRVINEGSTIVMKAINVNSGKGLKKAVSCAPRGKRALWMLNVQVGTQSISPLMWAIETGSLEAAKAIILDLLAIRADRDRYYYGMDILFERHPDIIKRLCLDAPALLPTLFDGLIWRSRVTENGQRRVNYYLKHMLVDDEGKFAKATEWITDNNDPKLVCHPVVAMVTDMVWGRVAFRTFMLGRTWFFFTLLVFISSQSILNHFRVTLPNGRQTARDEVRILIFCLRIFIYIFSMGHSIISHTRNIIRDVRTGATTKIGCLKVPEYLTHWQGGASFALTFFLVVMLITEPILHCLSDNHGEIFTEHCEGSKDLKFAYSLISSVAMLLYFLLLSDLAVFSTRVSAFALVCSRVAAEVALFLFGLAFFVAGFACAISALDQNNEGFSDIPTAALNLFKITLGMFSGKNFDNLQEDPALLIAIFVYVVTTIIFMLNLLIAQLNCAYQATYQDMLGFARLNRGKIVYETMPSVPTWRWARFVEGLHLDECVEFGEGDMGLAGGIQVFEPASANITTVDMIRRFGGSTSPAAQWPQEDAGDDEDDRFERMEKLIEKAMKRMTGSKGSRGGNSSSAQDSGSNQNSASIHESGSE